MRRTEATVKVTKHEQAEVKIETPMGPKIATYGKGGYYYGSQDRIVLTYRGEELTAYSVEELEKQVGIAETDFQTKKEIDRVRREIAKEPQAAHLVPESWSVKHREPEIKFLPIKVRGVDQRSGKALITMPDGSKDQVDSSRVLRPLDRDDIVDLKKSITAVRDAMDTEAMCEGVSLHTALTEAGWPDGVDLTVRLDLDTGERVCEFQGKEYRGKNARAIEFAVTTDLIGEEYPYIKGDEWDGLKGPVPVTTLDRLASHQSLFRTKDEVRALIAAEKHTAALKENAQEHLKEYQFDLTLVAGS